MVNKILNLSKQLVSIQSTSENSDALKKALAVCLSNVKDYTIEKYRSNGIESALVYNTDKKPKKFTIILNGHVDVIAGKKAQYKPKIVGNKLYGVGSMDMKASLACLILVFKNMAKKVEYPVGLQIVTDEQTGSINGTQYQVDKGVRADFVICGETTNFKVVTKAKGVYWVKIISKGKSSHSAYTWQGDNAIVKMNEVINNLQKKYPIFIKETWGTTVSLSHINTRSMIFNKIPDKCELWLDVRYIPKDKKTIIPSIKKMLPKGLTLKIVYKESPLLVNENNKLLKVLKKSAKKVLSHPVLLHHAHGTSDATYFTKVGCPGVEFGPVGRIGNTSQEYVDIPSLEAYYKILIEFMKNINICYKKKWSKSM